MASREGILRAGITKSDKIIEIGPSFNPLTPKRDGWNSYSVDHTDREGLTNKYCHDPSVNVELIEQVDFVWTEGKLSDAVPIEYHGTFDIFMASHVIEHIPDLIGFLSSAEILCRPDAKMILAVPDKRVCFDFFRPLSTTGDALRAYWEKRARHSSKTLWDTFAFQVTKHGGPGWSRTDQTSPVFTYSLEDALAWTEKYESEAYIDGHSWVFVPASFSLMMLELARLGFIDWRVERSEAAEYTEFYVWMQRGALARMAAMSGADLAAERMRLLCDTALELGDQGRQFQPVRGACLEDDLSRASATIVRLTRAAEESNDQLSSTQVELMRARSTLEIIRSSRAWRARTLLRRLLGFPLTSADAGARNERKANSGDLPGEFALPPSARSLKHRDIDALPVGVNNLARTDILPSEENSTLLKNDPVTALPSHQNAIDLFRGSWLSAMPSGSELTAGHVEHFSDARVTMATQVLGDLAGKTILELGPFEGYNSYQLDRAGADVVSIDNSPANFLKCLIIKNTFGLRATFMLGDFIAFMETTSRRFDVCWASGVLYHMTDPLRLLDAMSCVSDRLVIWSHYFDSAALSGDAGKYFDASQDRAMPRGDRDIKLHYRSYLTSVADRASNLFAGGDDQFSFWMELPDIKSRLADLGYTCVRMLGDYPSAQNGPACFMVALRD